MKNAKLQIARQRHNLTQTELGNLVGVKQTTIAQYENGTRNPSLSIAIGIANVLEIGVEDIFKDT